MNYFPQLTKEHLALLLDILKEDILFRYNNIEYWDEDVISAFYSNYGYRCCICDQPIEWDQPIEKVTEQDIPLRCEECIDGF